MTSKILELTSSILAAHASRNKLSPEELTKLLGDIYTKMVDLEVANRARLGQAFESVGGAEASATHPGVPILASPGTSEGGEGPATAEPGTAMPTAPAAPAREAGTNGTFDPDAWLASLPDRTSWAEAEAHSPNPNVAKGWVGVYPSGIICLIDGKSTRLLTSHLKRHYKDDPKLGTLEGYRSHFRLPPNYPNGCAEFKEAKSSGAFRHNEALRAGAPTRDAQTQKKIDKALAKSGLDLSRQINPTSRPGLFPFTIVCLECSAQVHNIADHLRSEHRMSLPKYLHSMKLSSRFPAQAPEARSPEETRELVREQIAGKKLKLADQVDGERWPGVFEDTILCLDDGTEVINLAEHLATKLSSNMAEYRLKYSLPDDYPGVSPLAAREGKAGSRNRRMARPVTESQAIRTRKGTAEVQVTRRPARKSGKVSLKL